jgi:arylsulfatase B
VVQRSREHRPKTPGLRGARLLWLLLASSPLLAGNTCWEPGPSHRPNVVLIVADDLGWNDVSYHGSDIETPNIDRLAREGVALERFYAAPICSPTRMGLLTGRWPIRWGMMHGVIRPWDTVGLPPEEETLAELLAWEGYARRAFVGKWHLGHARRDLHPLRQGFTEFYGHYNGQIDYFTHVVQGEVDWHRDFESLDEPGYSTRLLTDEAVRFIEGAAPEHRQSGRPFLLVLSYNAPHKPVQAPDDCLLRTRHLPDPTRARFAAVVSCLDDGIGRVLTTLDEAGVADDTIVWFLSDNGGVDAEGASNDPLRGEKRTLYEGGVRVPAIVRWPRGGLDGGRASDALVGYIDVTPTVWRMIGARRPIFRRFDGIDVLDVLSGRSPEPRREWFTYYYHHWSFTPERLAITTNTWKLIRRGWSILLDPDFSAPVELYRIRDDPTESSDVAASYPEVAHALLCRLFAFRSRQPDGAVALGDPQAPSGWRAPARWEIPPDPDPAPTPDPSRDALTAEPRWPDTAPGCRWIPPSEGRRARGF